MKKFGFFLLGAALFAAALSGCKNSTGKNFMETSAAGTAKTADEEGKKLKIVATIFPEYDWAVEILGENMEHADLTLLLDDGVDLHSYQPTAEDLAKISGCDLFLYVGGESDAWAEAALKDPKNPDRKVINLLEVLGDSAKEEEIVEGMEDGHGHEDGEAHDLISDEEGPEYDEHVWLSLKNAQVFCTAIGDALAELDPDNAEAYQANRESYNGILDTLDQEYQRAVDDAAKKTLLFADRFPFRYLADDYGLTYYAAFAGCSAETEASFETIAYLAGKADELELSHILTIEGSDGKLAETIAKNMNGGEKAVTVLTMDSMQSKTAKDISDGAMYYLIMEDNLEVLKEALN